MQDQFQQEIRAYRAYMHSKTQQERRDLWAAYAKIHASRSPELVRKMEAVRGLK